MKRHSTPRPAEQAFDAVIPFPLAPATLGLGLRMTRQGLASIDYIPQPRLRVADTLGARQIVRQLEAYFADGRWRFDVPLDLDGTPFQKRVWAVLRKIPAGQTRSYGQLAQQLRSAAQAVGQACRRNPVPLIVPCHRVVAATGLGGYGGAVEGERLDIKRTLLVHEGWTDGGG